VRHHEDRVEREQRRYQLRVGVAVHGLTGQGGHAAQKAGGGLEAAGRGQQTGRRGVRDRRVRQVLQGGGRADNEVLVLDAGSGQAETAEVEQVGEVDRRGEQPRAAAEQDDTLSGEVERILETGGSVIASDAVRAQSGYPPSTRF
jgi:hypothetical protein